MAAKERDSKFWTGFLQKQGGAHKTWKKRWVAVSGEVLIYFKSNTDHKNIKGLVHLDGAIIQAASTNNPKQFEIVQPSQRTFLFGASCEEERKFWVEHLTNSQHISMQWLQFRQDGFLIKKDHKRYFKLNNHLLYYKDKMDDVPTGAIFLRSDCSASEERGGIEIRITYAYSPKKWLLMASTPEEGKQWVKNINATIELMKGQQAQEYTLQEASFDTTPEEDSQTKP